MFENEGIKYAEYTELMQKTQEYILEYIDNENNQEEIYQNLDVFFEKNNFSSNRQYIKTLLYLLVKISNEHFRHPNFFEKIEKIIRKFEKFITKYFTNKEIFNIFKSNKRILLFLIKSNLMKIDQSIIAEMMSNKKQNMMYTLYFKPEIYQTPINEDQREEFEEKRKKGQNDNEICILIQNDSIEDFIVYVNKFNICLYGFIKPSIFETNLFLLMNNRTTLIEYAAFFGATQIFKYLIDKGVGLSSSVWLYSIHGDDSEIIKILEEKKIWRPKGSYDKCIKESIKCHHNHIFDFLLKNFDDIHLDHNCEENIISFAFYYHNFAFFPKEMKNKSMFYYACEYDHYQIVKFFLDENDIDINASVIFKKFIF